MVKFSDKFIQKTEAPANYLVVVRSRNSPVDKPRAVVHSGVSSLKQAIRRAEEKFISKFGNERHLFYRVQVELGDNEEVIPEEYWKEYKKYI